jgi:hypothetical protein
MSVVCHLARDLVDLYLGSRIGRYFSRVRSEPTFTTQWPSSVARVAATRSYHTIYDANPQRSVAARLHATVGSLLSGCGLHDLSTTRKGDAGVASLTEHDRFDQGLIDVRRPVPANQEIGSRPTGRISALDHKLD